MILRKLCMKMWYQLALWVQGWWKQRASGSSVFYVQEASWERWLSASPAIPCREGRLSWSTDTEPSRWNQDPESDGIQGHPQGAEPGPIGNAACTAKGHVVTMAWQNFRVIVDQQLQCVSIPPLLKWECLMQESRPLAIVFPGFVKDR